MRPPSSGLAKCLSIRYTRPRLLAVASRLRPARRLHRRHNTATALPQVGFVAPLTGTYTVVVVSADSGYDAVGDYILRLAKMPGAFTVPDGDQGGALTNGSNHPGHITIGDLDMWSFTANQNETAIIRIGEVGPFGSGPRFLAVASRLRPSRHLSSERSIRGPGGRRSASSPRSPALIPSLSSPADSGLRCRGGLHPAARQDPGDLRRRERRPADQRRQPPRPDRGRRRRHMDVHRQSERLGHHQDRRGAG